MCRHWLFIWLLAGPAILSGCSEKPRAREGEPTQADRERFSGRYSPPPTPPASTPVTHSTGVVDHDFLRGMSDHHKDLIRITHAIIESNSAASLDPAIRKFEDDHDHELDALLALLRTTYKDPYVPQTNPENDFIVEMLRKPGTDYAGIFLAAALKSEQGAVRILNDYLPKARNREVRTFAQRLSREEGGEMTALRRALNKR
jgi:uncharacterized protein (DUF305 family)